MPGERVHGHGADGAAAQAGLLVRRDKAGLHLLRQVSGPADHLGVTLAGTVVDHQNAAEHAAQQAEGGKGLADGHGVGPACLFQHAAHSRSGAVAAREAAGHHQGEPAGELGKQHPQQRDDAYVIGQIQCRKIHGSFFLLFVARLTARADCCTAGSCPRRPACAPCRTGCGSARPAPRAGPR